MESHAAQDVKLVLMHAGQYPLSGGGTANFVVGLKDCLSEGGKMDSGDNGDVFGWDTCTRRTWCNGEFKNSLPPTLLPIFKQMQTIAANGSGVTAVTSDDYFALAAEKEVFGTNKYADSTVELNLFQFDWYKTASNRQKNKGSWSRSHYLKSGFFFCYTSHDGDFGYAGYGMLYSFAPICCI